MTSYIRKTYLFLLAITEERTPGNTVEKDPIEEWRKKFYLNIIVILASLSIFAYVPSMIAALNDNLVNVAIINTFAFLSIQLIFFAKRISLQNKKISLITVLFIVGISLIISLGYGGPGLIYLTAVSVIAALLYNPLLGFVTIVTNSAAMIISYFINFPSEWLLETNETVSLSATATYVANYALLNLIIVSAIASLIKSLTKNLENEIQFNKQLEKKNKQYKEAMEKAYESDRLKSAFLRNMSHEVRTPLNGIIGYSTLMKQENSIEKLHDFSKMVIDSGYKLLQIITDIIDASIISSNQVKLIKNQINTIEFLSGEQCKWNEILTTYKKDNIHIRLNNEINICPKTIIVDEEKLSKVFYHLITNAVQHTKSGNIQITCSKEDTVNEMSFTIKDSGIGIAKKDLGKIFEPFIQVDKEFHEGNGLGLFIVKGFVDAWGGTVSLISKINIGSSFTFTLPFETKKEILLKTKQ